MTDIKGDNSEPDAEVQIFKLKRGADVVVGKEGVTLPRNAWSRKTVFIDYLDISTIRFFRKNDKLVLIINGAEAASGFAEDQLVTSQLSDIKNAITRKILLRNDGCILLDAINKRAKNHDNLGNVRPIATYCALFLIILLFCFNKFIFEKQWCGHGGFVNVAASSVSSFFEVYRTITANFVHVDTWHFMTNSVAAFYYFGKLERFVGTKLFFAFLLYICVASEFVSLGYRLFAGDVATYSIGMSGPIFGSITAMFVIGKKYRDELPYSHKIYDREILEIIVWTIFLFFIDVRIDHASHVGGIIFGAIFACGLAGSNLVFPKYGAPLAILLVPLCLFVTAFGCLFYRVFLVLRVCS